MPEPELEAKSWLLSGMVPNLQSMQNRSTHGQPLRSSLYDTLTMAYHMQGRKACAVWFFCCKCQCGRCHSHSSARRGPGESAKCIAA